MNSKQRSFLKGIAMTTESLFQIGKAALTPELTKAVNETLEKHELLKISVLQNCLEDPKDMAARLAARTKSEVVQVIGKKIVLYRQAKEEKHRKIVLPRD